MRGLKLVVVTAAFAVLAAGCPPPAPPVPTPPAPLPGAPTLQVSDYVTGLSRAWDIKFLPNGTSIYTENNSGKLLVRASDVDQKHEVGNISTLDTTAAFQDDGEGGLMGIALDPSFATNHFLYVCYSTTVDNRVARLTLDYPALPALSGWQLVLAGIPHDDSVHNGCRLDFQPGSAPPALFVTTGDAGVDTFPQDAASLGGKVLRIQTDGSAYPGNASAERWYTRGHRNPQGITFRPGTSEPYSIEHGPSEDDEVNHLENGKNGGWDGSDMNTPMLTTMQPLWKSGGITVAPSGGTFVSGPQWRDWNGALIVACLDFDQTVGRRILVFPLDGTGNLTNSPIPELVQNVRLRTAVQGPDGNLYVVTDSDNGNGKILKVVPS